MNFFTLLAVLFIGLKLTNYITWSWWLVLLPAYGGALIIIAFIILSAILAALAN